MVSTLLENILFKTPALHSVSFRTPGKYATKKTRNILEVEDLSRCVL